MLNSVQGIPKNKRVFVFFIIFLLYACDSHKAENVLQLPPGDAFNGQVVFAEMQCIECHTLIGNDYIDQLQEQLTDSILVKRKIELGIETTRVKTHSELITSIINPSHKLAEGYNKSDIAIDGKSIMPSYNDVLTVGELIDLVEFLSNEYDIPSQPLSIYPDYQIDIAN